MSDRGVPVPDPHRPEARDNDEARPAGADGTSFTKGAAVPNVGGGDAAAAIATVNALLASLRAGVSQSTQTAGSFSESMSYSNPDGDLYLTSAERKSLGKGVPTAFHERTVGR